jgi:acetylornithine deacetylase/succinyl-diaminopimelate desuccinylase-like protein
MHQIDERVPVAELQALTGVYRRVIESLLAPK